MSEHSKLSPSARVRWGACPGSVRECKAYPERPSGAAAIDGTHSHSLLEWCLKGPFGAIRHASEQVGQTMKDHEGEFVVDIDRAERVQFAVDYIKQRVALRESQGYFPEVISETRVHPDMLVHRDDMSGTVDVQIIDTGLIELIDYKDGMAPVEAEDNPQLQQYGVGVVAEMMRDHKPIPNVIRMTIIQPKLRVKGLDGVVTSEVPLGYLMVQKEKMIKEAAATDDPNAPLVPGEAQCKYCDHKGACSALANKAMADSGVVFANLDVAKDAAAKEPTAMTDKQIVEIMESAPLLRSMLEAVEAEAQRRLEAGQTIEGLKLVKGRGSRAWAYPDDEMVAKLKKFGVAKEAIYVTKLVSPAQAEKLTWEKKGEVCRLSERQVELLKKEYVKTVEGKPTITLASDPRPAIIVNAAPLFSAVTASDESVPSWLS